jgi:[ribosomal protein S5]-alanine N-acetyltransferase
MAVVEFDCGSCRVRPWRMDDLASLVLHADSAKIADNLRDRFPHPYTREAGMAWLAQTTSETPVTTFAIVVDDAAVGGIGFILGTDVERCSAEIGYWLGEKYWGRGIVTEALRAVTNHAFVAHGLTRVFAVPFTDNVASCRVLHKAGYTREGILRRSAIKHGIVRDQAMYAVVR